MTFLCGIRSRLLGLAFAAVIPLAVIMTAALWSQWRSDRAAAAEHAVNEARLLAAQVDDPRDFARARTIGPSDVQMRLRAINDVRQGTDPGTSWAVTLTPIGAVGGN